MKPDERIVLETLMGLGYSDVCYELDGNIPPDFVINGSIAVEARRLNIHHINEDGTKYAHEQEFRPMWQRIEKLISTYGSPIDGETWAVGFALIHPVKPWKQIRLVLEQFLHDFQKQPQRNSGRCVFPGLLEVDIIRCGNRYETFYVMGGGAEDVMGCFLVDEMRRNIELIIKEKTAKMLPFRNKYQHWWLALVDLIGQGIDEFDLAQLRASSIEGKNEFDRILIISPTKPYAIYEI